MYFGQRTFKKQRFAAPTMESILFGTGCLLLTIAITGVFSKFGENIISFILATMRNLVP
jgi:cytochrome c oxidase assembly factor CtaG